MKNIFTPPIRPANIPPPPEPWIYVGTAPFPDCGPDYVQGLGAFFEGLWDRSQSWTGNDERLHYAVLPGSPAALALGIGVEPEPVDDGGPAFRDAVFLHSLQGLYASGRPVCDEVIRDAWKSADKALATRKGGTKP